MLSLGVSELVGENGEKASRRQRELRLADDDATSSAGEAA
jgi:hypothetical protein